MADNDDDIASIPDFDEDVVGEEPDDFDPEDSGEQEEPSFTTQHANTERITSHYMTKYERARIIGTRALQIAMGAPVLVPLDGVTDPLEIALKELMLKVIPITVRRYLPDGSFEDWGIHELTIPS